jgi:hypothetical protein
MIPQVAQIHQISLNKKTLEARRLPAKKATSSTNTVSRPSGRPPQFRIEEGMGNQDAD